MADRNPMTVQCYDRLQEEVKHMKQVERPACSKAIEVARAHGDLSENAEYDAAKEAQGMLEARIKVLEQKIATAQVIDIETLSGDKVLFGATVQIEDVDSGEEKTVTIVGDEEADAATGLISYASPLARGLIGKNLDDIATVNLPAGKKEFEIRDISFSIPDAIKNQKFDIT